MCLSQGGMIVELLWKDISNVYVRVYTHIWTDQERWKATFIAVISPNVVESYPGLQHFIFYRIKRNTLVNNVSGIVMLEIYVCIEWFVFLRPIKY